jgi:hypothetical protein
MGIYRGAGGTGDATNDGYSEASIIRDLAAEVEVARDEAVAAAAEAEAAAESFDPSNFVETTEIGVTVQAYDADLTSWAGVATSAKQDTLVSGTNIKTVNSTSLLGSGDVAVQATLVSGTNIKTVNSSSLLGSGDLAVGDVTLTGSQTLTNKTLTMPVINGTIVEDVFTITDGAGFAIDPTNGSIQLVTLGASRTPTVANFDAGEAVTLMVADGTAYTITWTTIGVVWVGGSAPTLATSGYTVIELWRVGSTYYGALVGNVA